MEQSRQVFRESAAVYDLLYGDKDYVSETEWIRRNLAKHGCEPGANLLEFGSGTGRHARILGDLGYLVTAVEPSSEMQSRAEPHKRVTYLHGDTSSTDLDLNFDAVLALFHVMSYHTTLLSINAFFETAGRHLDHGGLFAFDVWYSPAVHSLVPEKRIMTKANSLMSVTRIAEPSEDIARSLVSVDFHYSVKNLETSEISNYSETHMMRHFTETEIQMFGGQHGFELVESSEFMSDAEPGRTTWGVWFVLRKK